MRRPIALAIVLFTIGACAGSRKGADAGGGPASTTGATGSASTVTGGTAPNAPGSTTGTPAANTAGLAPTGGGAKQGETCEDGKCAAGLQCITYYGIAGGSGPKFTSCEIRCDAITGKPRCPTGQNCVTIADGPGNVCRPSDM